MPACAYQFRPMKASDLPLVQAWLHAPHVREWWGEPEMQFALVRDDLSHPAMHQFIVVADERPFAYLQCYDPTVWPQGGLGPQPQGTRGIDQFIGEVDMLGRGHGSAFIRNYVDQVIATGAPRVVTDPDPSNRRAIRAYEKAGFREERLVETSDGTALLMVCHA
ncbi:MAG TPA: GNAT family N-acetyltransferase [Pseudolabrys sp.]|nr:GNAT family N-acetyltransferase [Pseudolabrys sp.]